MIVNKNTHFSAGNFRIDEAPKKTFNFQRETYRSTRLGFQALGLQALGHRQLRLGLQALGHNPHLKLKDKNSTK